MSETFTSGGEIVWRPTPDYVDSSHLKRFMDRHAIGSIEELLKRSAEDVSWFTEAVLDYLDVRFDHPYSKVVDLSEGIARPRWCVGGRLNVVASCLDRHLGTDAENRPAVLWEAEDKAVRSLSYGELTRQVKRCINGLRSLGLGKGDVIGIYMPMVPETVIAFLAVIGIGAIALPLFSGYAAPALVTRLVDAEAKAVVTADGFVRRGRLVPMKPIVDEALAACPGVERTVVLRYAGNRVSMCADRDVWWHDVVPHQPTEARYEPTEAEDPLMLLYTSGTTGLPKGTVHTHCGFPVKAAQDMAFGTDVHAGDRFYWMTDMGWMMGPWLVFGATLLGATMFLYDGAPDHPGPDRVWEMVERHRITGLGLSPTFVRAIIPHGQRPVRRHDLASLRLFASTGEPWNPVPWRWLFDTVGRGRLPIINYSGGTEISGGILMGNPLSPLKPTAFSGPCPGIAADVVDETGKPVRNQLGELVIRAPWIGMTRGFWKDSQRYLDTYWSRFPDCWLHGDFAAIDEDGFWYLLGRSDDTINTAGKRLGPAEIESILVEHPSVVEAAVIGVPDAVKGSALLGFCVLGPGVVASDDLCHTLCDRVAAQLGKPFKPRGVEFVKELPKTRNAKVMRRIIRAAYLGEEPGDLSALENPSAVSEIRATRPEDR